MRVVNRLLALLIALALLAAGVVLIIEIIAEAAGADPVVFDWRETYRWAARTSWESVTVRTVGVLLAIGGLALLVLQLVPRRPDRLPVRGDDGTDAAITRRGLAYSVSDAVNEVDGVNTARVQVRRRSVKVKARARPGLADGSAREAATDAARHRLDELNLSRPPRVTVNVANGGR